MSRRPLALVTGGCRRLGAAIATALAGAGYDLALHGSHDADPEPSLAEALTAAGGVWQGFVADFADPARATALYAEVTACFGWVPDLLVNGASLFGQDVLADVTADDLAQAHAINAAAPVLLMQAFTATAGEGDRSIVNILDQRIAHPHPDQLSYTLAKLALAGATRIGAAGVRVNGVAPGLTLPTGDYTDDQMAALADLMPLRRLPTPDDIAAAVLFCASMPSLDRQILYVDGGAHLVPFARDFVHLTG
ncbi:short-chain dehydrogenase [Sphingomonas sp. Leaf339]|uniref:SDR family oxidoreductase n=1 Tax=Sphingomonas sp. Leaf339 TaxID=1736343 RepID=UPI0006FC502A|nr:SDR family oxidoreductase [Sphingomonas sp. Leaf339]KQU56016.1 short-chain dehydrogenase [Sphingomonas sp. Leaf339]